MPIDYDVVVCLGIYVIVVWSWSLPVDATNDEAFAVRGCIFLDLTGTQRSFRGFLVCPGTKLTVTVKNVHGFTSDHGQ